MNNLHQQFSSIVLLNILYTKIRLLFHSQLFILTILASALKRSLMIGILGREGMGKSSAVAKFRAENKNVYYVRIGQSYHIQNLLDEMIFQVSGVYPKAPDTLFTKMKQLSSLLTRDSEKKLIIIDDAGKLSPRGLGFFHELRDNTMQCTGFAFVGLPYYQKHLLQAIKLQVTGVAEFYRRTTSWYTVPGLKNNEISEYGITHKLNEEQLSELMKSGIETIAELETETEKILEEAEEAKKEKRAPRKIKEKDKETLPSSDTKDDDNEEEEDELEEAEAVRKKEAAKKAREAKQAKGKTAA